ncbi:hypothetical protein [Sphingobium nicotianae]|uniref:Uncharacterized protein n=1 Tax=Sphingobium nicotianae TaxID=2782607 RepID=A0A9X1IT96_9SPHN|nr:hypothetical protein [Sphingobium nicotianae]MBT2189373.1 hypothetical protein [Sphingobium nicotianae]
MRHAASAIGALCFALGTPAFATDCPTGDYRAAAGPDTAAGLQIGKDGHFRYFMSEGAVDEHAEGRWTCKDGTVLLTTEPTPKPAEFKLAEVTQTSEAPLEISVTDADGHGLAGVDFNLTFDKGEPVTGYTQEYGWTLSDLQGRAPVKLQVAEPFFGTISPVFSLPAGRHLKIHVVLIPNDMGVAAFKDTPVTSADGKLRLHWRGGELPFVRRKD